MTQQGRLGLAPGIQGWAVIPQGQGREAAIPPANNLPTAVYYGGFRERRVTFTLAQVGDQQVAIDVRLIS